MSRLPRGPMPLAGRCALLLACSVLPGQGRAAEPPATPAVSRAVEVPPPAGWTPDTPLFQEGVVPPVRPARPAVPAVQRPSVKMPAAATPASRVRVTEHFAKTAAARGAKAAAESVTKSAAKSTAKSTVKPAAKGAPKITPQPVRSKTGSVGKQARGQAPKQMVRRTPTQPKAGALTPARVGASKGKARRAPTAAVASTTQPALSRSCAGAHPRAHPRVHPSALLRNPPRPPPGHHPGAPARISKP